MRVQLWGIGTQSASRAITAQKRINCIVEKRTEEDRTTYAVTGRPGLRTFISAGILGAQPSRGLWAVNTLSTPMMFDVNGFNLNAIDNSGVVTTVGALSTNSGDVSMADDGTFLVLVDGQFGYVYNMSTGTFTVIVDGNFTTTPRTVTWQDNYFIVTSQTATRQFQLSQISPSVDPTVWPAVQINFAGSGGGKLQNGVADHNILQLFGDLYTEFWQDTGSPDFPYAKIPGASQQFGLAAPFSAAKFDNSIAGLFQDPTGALNVSRLAGFGLQKLSNSDIEYLLKSYSAVADAKGFGFTVGGHPLYMLNLPTAGATHVYDGLSQVWSEYQSYGHSHFKAFKCAYFQGSLYMSDHEDGTIYAFDPTVYQDSDSTPISLELISKHIWNDDKFIGISSVQVDVQAGVGTATGQGSDPVMQLEVSKDGGNSFFSVGYQSIGKVGEYTQRCKWGSMGGARDWVLKLVITDPVKRVLTGASAEIVGGPF